jgi:hypothetical protein
MFGWLKSSVVWGRVIEKLIIIYREWKRKRTAEKSQAEFDRIERDPRRAARRMFDRDDAD